MLDLEAMTREAASGLAAVADPAKAAPMAAYLKTDMPFYGVQKAGRTPVLRAITDGYAPRTNDEYVGAVRALWDLPHREEKYLALGYARRFEAFIGVSNLALYGELIVEGGWWDLVDEAAIRLVGVVLRTDRDQTTPVIRAWNEHIDLWLRRTSIICQVGAKKATDPDLLKEMCTPRLAEKDFFIRKAIGWALRDYARTDPEAVIDYVAAHRDEMSGLSHREATKHLG